MNTNDKEYYLKKEFYEKIREDSKIIDFILKEPIDGIWYWDYVNKENEWVSPTFWKTLGYDPKTKKNLISEWENLVDPEDIELAYEQIENYVNNPDCPYDQIVRYKHKDGSTIWLKCRVLIIRDEDGCAIRILGAHSDVSSSMNLKIENKMRSNIMEGVSNPVFIKDMNLRYMDFNVAFQSFLGLKASEIYNKTVFEVTNKVLSEEYDKMDQLLLRGIETSQIYESKVVSQEGEIRSVIFNKQVIKDDDGKPFAIVGVITDITDFRNKETELKETKKRLDMIFNGIHDSMSLVSCHDNNVFRYQVVNHAFKIKLKLKNKDIIGKEPYEVYGLLKGKEKVDIYSKSVESQEVTTHKSEELISGVKRYYETAITPLVTNGKISHLAVLKKDVTENYRMMMLLEESTDKLKRAQQIAHIGHWEWNFLESSFKWSDEIYAILGIVEDDTIITREKFREFIHPEDLSDYSYEVENALKSYEVFNLDFRVIRTDEGVRYVHVRARILRDYNNTPTWVIGTLQDISERKIYENELIEAKNKAETANIEKSRFVANMSHEIRTPLNGVVGMLQVLEMTDISEQQADYIKIARESSEILLKVINDILSYSKIEAGKIEFEIREFNLFDLVYNTVEMFNHLIKEKGLVINTFIEVDLPQKILGDSLRIKQIITNIISNAVKFTHQGEINLRVKQKRRLKDNKIVLEFQISDTGIGIPKDKLDKIFSSFTQADSSNTREYGGTGLGLAICKGLIEQMDGTIWVESQAGYGSDFYFTLTLSLPENEEEYIKNEYLIAKNSDEMDIPIHLLVVEDNKISSMVISEVITSRGWKVSVARDGAEGVEAYKKGEYDAVIMDIEMPNLDGYQATQMIRKVGKISGQHTPIIAMTAFAQEGDRDKCLDAGMDDYLTKPIDAVQFYSTVEYWLKKR